MIKIGKPTNSLPSDGSKLAPTMASTGPKDKLEKKDIYNAEYVEQAASVAKSALGLDSLLPQQDKDAAYSVGGYAVSDILNSAVTVGAEVYSGTGNGSVTNRIKDVTAGDAYRRLSPDMKTGLFNTLLSKTGLAGSEATVIVDGVATAVATEDIGNVTNLMGLVQGLTGSLTGITYMDIGAKVAYAAAALDLINQLGIPSLADKIINSIDDKRAREEMMISRATMFAQSADIETLNKIIDLVGLDGLLERVPRLIEFIVAGYSFPNLEEGQVVDYPAQYARLHDFMMRVNPKWSETVRNNVPVVSFKIYAMGSPDFKTLFKRVDIHTVALLASEQYPEESLSGVIQKHHPLITLLNN